MATQLTGTQRTTLKNHIIGNSSVIATGQFVGVAINAVPNSADGNFAIAAWYNLAASPAFTVWKKLVTLGAVGKAFDASELAGLSGLNNDRLRTLAMYLASGVDPSVASVRSFFDDIFSGAGGANTRAALLILWKRLATNAQKVFSAGTGSDLAPATTDANVLDNFALTPEDVELARNS